MITVVTTTAFERVTADELAQHRAFTDPGRRPVWIDFEAPTDEQLERVGDQFKLDPEALEDAVAGEPRPRVDPYDDHFLIVLYGAYGAYAPEGETTYTPRKLVLICGRDWLITIHSEPLRTIRTLHERAEKQNSRVVHDGPHELLYRIVDMMVDNYVLLSDRFEDRIEEIEEAVLQIPPDPSFLEQTLSLRRDIVSMRRIAASIRELLTPIATGTFDYINSDLAHSFSHVEDHILRVVEYADGQRERLAAARDHYLASLAAASNEVMQTLTVVAAVMLPLSLIAGIYGMNVPVWPEDATIVSFWVLLLIMGGIGVALLYYFRRKGWI